jgi:RNA polymerase sigma-70 factor (ECF subfamily)
MRVMRRGVIEDEPFAAFVDEVEPRLRLALVASYGPADGRVAAADALSWAWEHWDEVRTMANPVGYLYRVGQTAMRRHRPRPIPITAEEVRAAGGGAIDPGLIDALARLPIQQRTTVMLVHAFGWTVRDVASMLGLAPSTVQTHVARALERLRALLEDDDDGR